MNNDIKISSRINLNDVFIYHKRIKRKQKY
jgi:hypothetical protein